MRYNIIIIASALLSSLLLGSAPLENNSLSFFEHLNSFILSALLILLSWVLKAVVTNNKAVNDMKLNFASVIGKLQNDFVEIKTVLLGASGQSNGGLLGEMRLLQSLNIEYKDSVNKLQERIAHMETLFAEPRLIREDSPRYPYLVRKEGK